MSSAFGFPAAESLDYQAQHTLDTFPNKTGRYDGLYLSGGYPYLILEAKKYSHELEKTDEQQARSYATSEHFDKPVPFIVVSNGREHRFLKIATTLDPGDGRPTYGRIPATTWKTITSKSPGEVRRLVGANELLEKLLDFKEATYRDIRSIFADEKSGKLDLDADRPLAAHLKKLLMTAKHI